MNFAKCQGEGGGGSGARLHRTPTRAVLNGEVSPLHSLTVIYDMSSRLSQMPVHCEGRSVVDSGFEQLLSERGYVKNVSERSIESYEEVFRVSRKSDAD